MKKVILSVLIGCFAVLSVQAQKTTGPQIEFTKDVHDYGTIENGADGTCEFKFKNTGNEDLLISNCRASCGCTIPSWPKEAIAKGKTGIIQVKYDTKRTGGIHKTITITSNAVNTPSKVLTIKGQINPPVAVDAPAPMSDVQAETAVYETVDEAAEAVDFAVEDAAEAVVDAVEDAVDFGAEAVDAAGDAAEEVTMKSNRKWYQFWKKK